MKQKGNALVVVLVIIVIALVAIGGVVWLRSHSAQPMPQTNATSTPSVFSATSTASSTIQSLVASGTVAAFASAVPVEVQKITWLGKGLIGVAPTSTKFGDPNGWSTGVANADGFETVISKVTKNIPGCDPKTDPDGCYGARNAATIGFSNEIVTTNQVTDEPGGAQSWGDTYSIFKESQDNGGGLQQDFTLLQIPDLAGKKIVILAHYSQAFCCDASTYDNYKLIIADLTSMTTKVYSLTDLAKGLP